MRWGVRALCEPQTRARDPTVADGVIARIKPLRTAHEYTTAINQYGRVLAWRRAIELLQGMASAEHRMEPNVFTYSAAITACMRAEQTNRALELLSDMRTAGIPPNEITYTALLRAYSMPMSSACDADYYRAISLWDEMLADGLTPTLRCACAQPVCPLASANYARLVSRVFAAPSRPQYGR